MQDKTGRLTERKALALSPPSTGYQLHWCPQTPGFGVRVTSAGARAWICERRVNGKTVRRTLGKVSGRGAISSDAARKLMVETSSELQRGIDRLEAVRQERAERARADAETALTFEAALDDYVKRKRRTKDGLALKERTKTDYLAMVKEGRITAEGRKLADGELFALAGIPVTRITAEHVHQVFNKATARGERRGVYAMQVLRAVLNWHGVKVPGNPLGKDVAGKDRIVLRKTSGAPKPIPPEKLGPWWQEAAKHEGQEAADFCRLILLTGARPIELEEALAEHVDADCTRLLLRDTKNRTDHLILLSQPAASIVARQRKGKKPKQHLFTVRDPRKTLATINKVAGTTVKPHGLRATFASVAEELVSAYTLKRMLNHTNADDITGTHYVGKSESQLRTAWQTVADFIEQASAAQSPAAAKQMQ